MKDFNLCIYESMRSKDNKTVTLDDYVSMVKYGANQDAVISARAEKEKGNKELYDKIKQNSKVVTPTGVFPSGLSKTRSNLTPNGLICIDIDSELTDAQIEDLYHDHYTYVIHRSFGGEGLCVFVRIDPKKIDDAYSAISKYYYDSYGVLTDLACSNPNRLRFLSFDPEIHVNEKAPRFNVRIEKKDAQPKDVEYIFTKNDFDNILEQIRDRHIDLCKEDYFRYIRIGLSIASELGESGRDAFHFVCSFGSKYNKRHTDRDYSGFVRNGSKMTIGTFYYYCKEEGIELYSEKTRTIINRVKIAKTQGSPTVESIKENLLIANNIKTDKEDEALINELIKSNKDYSKNANQELSDIEQLANFIVDAFDPKMDEITRFKYVKGTVLEDTHINDIYLSCKKSFDFNVAIGDVRSILNSSYVKKFNNLKDFIRDNEELNPVGYIDKYADLIGPKSEYNRWAFKKWIVGCMHNWFCDFDDREASPLTLVLTGQKHGIGKSSFFRNLLPKELSRYMIQSKLDKDKKDTMFRLGKYLIILDDEFGGKAFKDDKDFKEISDQTHITDRLVYGSEDTTLRRRATLCGTSNEIDILKDVTGNRRILPINVESVDYESLTAFDNTSLIIEAYNLYKSGFEWRIFSEEDKNYIEENTSSNRAIIPVEELFFEHFSLEKTLDFPRRVVMNQGEILQFLSINTAVKPTRFDIKDIFIKNKLSYQSHRIGSRVKSGIELFAKNTDFPSEIVENSPF